jgi:hypothetical protein
MVAHRVACALLLFASCEYPVKVPVADGSGPDHPEVDAAVADVALADDGAPLPIDAAPADAPLGPVDAGGADAQPYLSYCGDGFCDHDEDCFSCVPDCLECPPGCGDETCEPLESEACSNCPADCVCGTSTCEEAWTCAKGCGSDSTCITNCAQSACYEEQLATGALFACLLASCPDQCADMSSTQCLICAFAYCGVESADCYGGVCGPQDCGDSTCQPEEDCVNCPGDCGACPDLCGDGTCQPAEDCGGCPDDCGVCCGNGVCAPDEACDTCPDDCGTCPPFCGDGICEALLGEDSSNCPTDCAVGTETCGQVMTCFFACSDMFCGNDCLAAGCPAAQAQAQAVVTCAATSCLMECLNPSASTCNECLTSSCGDEMLSCMIGFC